MSYSNAYSNAYIWNLEKMVLKNLFTGQQWRKRHRGQTYRHGERRGEERVRCMERVTWKITLPYVKQIANGNLLYGSGNSNRGSESIQRGGMGRLVGGRLKKEGTYVYLWLIHVDVWQKPTQFCKSIILQLKQINVKHFF